MKKIITILICLYLTSCAQKDVPVRNFGDNPFAEDTTSNDNLIVGVECRQENGHIQSAIHTNKKMIQGDATFYFSWKVSTRNKRDTVALYLPYLMRTWIKSPTPLIPANSSTIISDVVFIRAENVKQKNITYQAF